MDNAETPDEEIKELYAYGAGLQSLSDIVGLGRFIRLEFLSLHGNHIEQIEGLEGLPLLKELNLSSNRIKAMDGLSKLSQLQIMNLSCNHIEEIKDLQGLFALRKLLLSHNQISCLGGLSALHGPRYALQVLDLRDNLVSSLAELDVLAGCVNLTELVFSLGNYSNPICRAPAYKSAVVATVSHILKLDGKTLFGESGSSGMSQCPSLTGGILQCRSAASSPPSRALDWKGDNLQNFPFDAEQANPRQVYVQPQAEILISSQQQRRQNTQPEPHFRKPPNSHLYVNQGQFCYDSSPPAAQTSTFHSPRINQPSPSHLRSMGNPPHPLNNKILTSSDLQTLEPGKVPGQGHSTKVCTGFPLRKQSPTSFDTGRDPRTEIIHGVWDVPKADRSSQKNPEAWLGALENRILNLIQQLPNVKADSHRELFGHHDDAAVCSGGSKVQRLDERGTFPHQRRKQNGRDFEMNKAKANCSSGNNPDCHKTGLESLGWPTLSSGDSGSESPEGEITARRWVHIGDKWKGKKATSPCKSLGKEVVVTPANDALEVLYEEVKSLQVGLASLTAMYRRQEVPDNKLREKTERTIDSKQDEKETTLCKLTSDCSLLESKLVNSEEKFSEERKELLKRLESEEEGRKKLQEILKAEQEERRKLHETLNAEKEERRKLYETLHTEKEERRKLHETRSAEKEERRKLHETLNAEKEERRKLHETLSAEKEERKKLQESLNAEQEKTNELQKTLEAKGAIICHLEKTMQDKDVRGKEMSKQIENFAAERGQIESFIQEKYRRKYISLNTEVFSLKEALNVATQARQNAESALLDATTEKESNQQLAMSLGRVLEEQKAKLGVSNSDVEACKSRLLELQEQVDKSSNDFLDAKVKNEEALEQLSNLHKQELQEAIARESVAGESRGMLVAEKNIMLFRDTMDAKLKDAEKELQKAHAEIAKLTQDMCNLRNEKEQEEATLKDTIRRILLKEQGRDELVVELSSVVRSQKLKLQTAQYELARIAEVEEELHNVHQDMIVVRRKADKYDKLVSELDCLQEKLAEVTSEAERQKEGIEEKFREQLYSFQKENERLMANSQKLQGAEDAVRVKNKMLDSQNETIRELKLELSEARECFRTAIKTSESLGAEWNSRLQLEGKALQTKLAEQESTMTALEDKLRFERVAKAAAEKASKALQDKLAEKDTMFSYVEEEISHVKQLYDSKLKEVGVQRDQAMDELKVLHQEKEKLQDARADEQRRREELFEASKTQVELQKADAIEKNLQLAQAFQRVVELESELKSQNLATESQKLGLVSKLDQLYKLLEELREGN